MHHFIDRRRNPSGKSLSNRQRLGSGPINFIDAFKPL